MEIIDVVRTLLGITTFEKDIVLQVYIDIITQRILNYCNITVLPKELEFTVSQMAVDLYREQNGKTNSETAPISSISEGSRTVSYNSSLLLVSVDEKISKMQELNKFKSFYKW